MNSKSIALVIVFAAVAIALNVIRIPTVFYPGGYFQFSQIPIVIAFLLLGVKIGVFVGLLNVVGGLVLFPIGAIGLINYPMDFVSSLIMFAGMWVMRRFIINRDESRRGSVFKKPAFLLTIGAILARVGIMPFVDYAVIYHVLVPLVLGLRLTEAYILGLVPAFVLYNAIVPLYVVSVACVVAAKVNKVMNRNSYLS
jgi:hypothetical protein